MEHLSTRPSTVFEQAKFVQVGYLPKDHSKSSSDALTLGEWGGFLAKDLRLLPKNGKNPE